MTKRPLIFMAVGEMSQAKDLEENYPFKFVQALIMAIEEAEAWVKQGLALLGEDPPDCVSHHRFWLSLAEDCFEEVRELIRAEEIKNRNKSADDPINELIEATMTRYPENDFDDWYGEDAPETIAIRMAVFWVEQSRNHLINVQKILLGDGEILGQLSRQDKLSAIHA
jgi:hypothetical protein